MPKDVRPSCPVCQSIYHVVGFSTPLELALEAHNSIQARLSREAFLLHRRTKHTAPTHSARWHACACLALLRRRYQSTSLFGARRLGLILRYRYLDVPMLVSWLSARQHAPEGGFTGRTNKLVDACYSHWVGGCWPLLEAALNGPQPVQQSQSLSAYSLYNREGLIRYITTCCQSDSGGLKDKPSK